MTQQRWISVWRPGRGFEHLVRNSAQDSRPHVQHDDYGDRGFTGSVAIRQLAGPYRDQRAIFRWDDHLDRFDQTAAAIASVKRLPCSRQVLTDAVGDLVEHNDQPYIRCSIGGGGEVKVYAPGEAPHFHICTEAIDPITRSYLGPRVAEEGMRILVTNWRRGYPDEVTLAKTASNYTRSINAKDEAVQAGFDEGALVDCTGDRLSEISVANIILIKGRRAYTPDRQSGALNSITRRTAEALLLDLKGIGTDPILIGPQQVSEADEILACGTAIGCIRICELLWPAKSIHWTLRRAYEQQVVPVIDAAYTKLIQGLRPDYHPEWLTPLPTARSHPPEKQLTLFGQRTN